VAEVPATATPLTASETAPAFLSAWAQVFDGAEPSRTEAEWLLALLWNENAKGRAIIQHNWGNLSTTASADRDYWRPPWFDPAVFEAMDEPKRSLYRSIHERMLKGQEPSAFRAFPDHATGARAWVSALKRNFQAILKAARKNSAVAMQDAIFNSRYCTSPGCKTNAESYRRLRAEIRSKGLFAALPDLRSGGGGAGVLLLGAVFLGGATWLVVRKTR